MKTRRVRKKKTTAHVNLVRREEARRKKLRALELEFVRLADVVPFTKNLFDDARVKRVLRKQDQLSRSKRGSRR